MAFAQDLHRVFQWQLDEARKASNWDQHLAGECSDFQWYWWVSGQWPQCATALSRWAADGSGEPLLWNYRGLSLSRSMRDPYCALVHAQQWGAQLFVLYKVTLAFTFLDRYDSLLTRGPLSNKVLCCVAVLVLAVHMAVGWVILRFSCGEGWHRMLLPSWDAWVAYIGIWPLVAVAVSECAKRRDHKYHVHLQRTLRVLFNTRLGMWSPR